MDQILAKKILNEQCIWILTKRIFVKENKNMLINCKVDFENEMQSYFDNDGQYYKIIFYL